MFYFGQVFFCRLISKNVLKRLLFMLMISTLRRSVNLLHRNRPNLCSWLRREGRHMPITVPLLLKADKSSHRRCSIKKAVRKKFSIFTGKHLCWSLLNKVAGLKGLQHRSFRVNIAKFLKTSRYGCFWTDFRKWLFRTLFLDSCFDSVIL